MTQQRQWDFLVSGRPIVEDDIPIPKEKETPAKKSMALRKIAASLWKAQVFCGLVVVAGVAFEIRLSHVLLRNGDILLAPGPLACAVAIILFFRWATDPHTKYR